MKSIERATFFVLPALVAAGVLFAGARADSRPTIEVLTSNTVQKPAVVQPAAAQSIDAQAAISMEMTDKQAILYGQSKDRQLPIASLTKLMTTLVVMDYYDMDQHVVVSPQAMTAIGEQGQLKAGDEFTVKNLLYIMLMESSNRAAQALSEVVGTQNFVALMNQKAVALGLSQTHYEDPAGLDGRSRSSAADIAKLSTFIFENYPLFRQIVAQKEFTVYTTNEQVHHVAVSTNKLLDDGDIIGGKTGWTDQAQGCMMVIRKKDNRYIVYVVLGAHDRVAEMQKLISRF